MFAAQLVPAFQGSNPSALVFHFLKETAQVCDPFLGKRRTDSPRAVELPGRRIAQGIAGGLG
jgi:hypothetical protein